MKHFLLRLPFVCFLLLLSFAGQAQRFWSKASYRTRPGQQVLIQTTKSNVSRLDENSLTNWLNSNATRTQIRDNFIMELPNPDGGVSRFKVWETQIQDSALAAKYPRIRTYAGQGIENRTATVYFDITYQGFHAMVRQGEFTYFIDPLHHLANDGLYQIYYKKDYVIPANKQNLVRCLNEDGAHNQTPNPQGRIRTGGTMRTYRAAFACTGEYATFHGGTKPLVHSAIVTSVNRVSGVYTDELSIRFELVANNDTLIYLNASTDPFNNTNANTLINQSQTVIDQMIGTANYDFGHTFSTGGGGLAGLGVICRAGQKARGITGSPSPINDPYDIDYVAHEVGHEFGGNHTFNGNQGSCAGGNRSATHAYEPGSGTTIMAYAGICGSNDLQAHSDAYFHAESLREIYNYAIVGQGNTCAATAPTGNNPPDSVKITDPIRTIPKSTYFELVGKGTDPDGDSVTYCWEQFDLGAAGSQTTPVGNAPSFRSYNPSISPIRTFPKLSAILTNTSVVGEVLPTYARTLGFRLTIRDNKATGGGFYLTESNYSVNVNANAGPFIVTSQNTQETWNAGSPVIISWNVAGTDANNINCQNVMILFSKDGGNTFKDTLKYSTPNDGVDTIIAPGILTNGGRIKVKAVDNIFFDINNKNIIIQCTDAVSLASNQGDTTVCEGDSLSVKISALSQNNLPVQYTWTHNGSGISNTDSVLIFPSINMNDAGNYACTMKSSCSSAINASLNITVLPVPAKPVITRIGDTTLSISNFSSGTIKWFLNGQLISNTTSSINPTSDGVYTVLISNGKCTSTLSDTIQFQQRVISTVGNDIFMISPNPIQSGSPIDLHFENQGTDQFYLEVSNMAGKIMHSETIQTKGGFYRSPMDLSDLRNGMYIIKVYYNGKTKANKLTVY